jgi:hypothetical protein
MKALTPEAWSSLILETWGYYFLEDESSSNSPKRYLEFASDDLAAEDSDRNRVNAISNAKRALHYRVELLADALGFRETRLKRDFPNQLGFCEKCGIIVAPEILKRLNKRRNALEHDYYVPKRRDEAEDFVDVVRLFLATTRSIALKFPTEFHLASQDDPDLLGETASQFLEATLQRRAGKLKLNFDQLTLTPEEFDATVRAVRLELDKRPRVVSDR